MERLGCRGGWKRARGKAGLVARVESWELKAERAGSSQLRIFAEHCSLLTKQIFARRSDDAGGGNVRSPVLVASNDDRRITGGFAHEESRRGGEFIGNSEDGGTQKFAVAIALAAKIEQRGNA